MPRPIPQETGTAGHDSFLDIVANIVGILIILVMVVGVRVKNFRIQEPDEDLKATAASLDEGQRTARRIRDDVLQMTEQTRSIRREAAMRFQERDRLATMVSGMEHEIESRRGQLDEKSQQLFDLNRRLAEARSELDRLERQRAQAVAAEPETILIESFPTPLSKPVDSNEVHCQLRGGRVTVIPLDSLVERFQNDVRRKVNRLRELPEITDTVGPDGGFRLRYTIYRFDVPPEEAMRTGRGGFYARLKRWTLIPTSNDLGEPIDIALAAGSRFHNQLARLDPRRATITIWTYPDSFEDFRRLKKVLYQQGFACAARPLPHGVPITGSPEGSKSAAE